MIHQKKITIIHERPPRVDNVNEDLTWFCNSLGLFGNRDKDKSTFRLFIVLLKGLKSSRDLSSDEISDRVGLSRGTVVHHLHKLINSGLVQRREGRYFLRVRTMSELVDEVENDLMKTLRDIREVAKDIDRKLLL